MDGTGADDNEKRLDERNKGIINKNCAPFTDCISETNNTQIDNAQDLYVVMPMYNLIEYSNNYSKTLGSLWQYYRNRPNIFKNSDSIKFKMKIAGKTPPAGNKKDVKIAVPLKYFSNFWRTLEMPLIHCEINLILTWSTDCIISSATAETKFAITDTKLYVPIVTLTTQDNAKLLEQIKSWFQKNIQMEYVSIKSFNRKKKNNI